MKGGEGILAKTKRATVLTAAIVIGLSAFIGFASSEDCDAGIPRVTVNYLIDNESTYTPTYTWGTVLVEEGYTYEFSHECEDGTTTLYFSVYDSEELLVTSLESTVVPGEYNAYIYSGAERIEDKGNLVDGMSITIHLTKHEELSIILKRSIKQGNDIVTVSEEKILIEYKDYSKVIYVTNDKGEKVPVPSVRYFIDGSKSITFRDQGSDYKISIVIEPTIHNGEADYQVWKWFQDGEVVAERSGRIDEYISEDSTIEILYGLESDIEADDNRSYKSYRASEETIAVPLVAAAMATLVVLCNVFTTKRSK